MQSKSRKTRDPSTYNIDGFLQKLPPDRDGSSPTVAVPVRLEEEDAAFLAAQEHGRSYHMRQAVSGYIAEFEILQEIANSLGLLPGEAIAYCIRQVAAKAPF